MYLILYLTSYSRNYLGYDGDQTLWWAETWAESGEKPTTTRKLWVYVSMYIRKERQRHEVYFNSQQQQFEGLLGLCPVFTPSASEPPPAHTPLIETKRQGGSRVLKPKRKQSKFFHLYINYGFIS